MGFWEIAGKRIFNVREESSNLSNSTHFLSPVGRGRARKGAGEWDKTANSRYSLLCYLGRPVGCPYFLIRVSLFPLCSQNPEMHIIQPFILPFDHFFLRAFKPEPYLLCHPDHSGVERPRIQTDAVEI